MSHLSSNNIEMELTLDSLKNIQKLDVPEYIEAKIRSRIREMDISPRWVIGIAASLALFIGVEIIIVNMESRERENNVLEAIVPNQTFDIYE